MSRYIDADEALKFIRETNANYHWLLSQYSASWIYDFIESRPDADVVPKSEVERLRSEIADLQDALKCEKQTNAHLCGEYMSAKCEVAREIFEEIEKIRAKEIHRCEVIREKEKDAAERKYWEGGQHALLQLSYWFAELKKKYTNN